MKFRKFGKALLMGAISTGAILGVTSCVQSYTVGFLYVTGTKTADTTGQGIISGFKIDHNTGKLTSINGMPISSGGAYPGRAVLTLGSRFVYVLNQGGDDCTTNASDTNCANANIQQFLVSANGALTPQQTFYTQGKNPFRIIADSTGAHIYVLDHDAPDSGTGSSDSCALALGSSTTTCGDITAFSIDSTTGRLSLLVNAQVSSASGSPLPYFPVPVDPIDFLLSSNYVFTLSGNSTTGDFVFPYAYNTSSGQLTVSQNSIQTLNIAAATAIQQGNSYVYVLDNEPLTIPSNTTGSFDPGTYPAQILPYTVGTGGALQAQTGGAVPDVPAESNPMFLLAESKGKWVYVANSGDNTDANVTNTQSGIAGFVIDTSTKQLTEMSGSPFGSGAGPACLLEDPSDQFIYTANYNDSSVTGAVLDQNVGTLSALPGSANKTYSLPGPAAYCLVNGRTD
jgi:6-phosphogluconolactonase